MIEMPLTLIQQVKRRQMVAAMETRSPFSAVEQLQDWGGRWWEFDVTFAIHSGRDARRMEGFFAALNGPVTPFVLRDPSVRQVLAAPVVVSGAGQSGSVLVTAGWAANSPALLAGDFLQVGVAIPRLHIVTADANANASGVASLPIWPPLREVPANGEGVSVQTPGCAVRMIAPFEVTRGLPDRATFTVTMREALAV